MAKKRVKRKIVKKQQDKSSKIQLIVKNLVFFLVLTILSSVLLYSSQGELLIQIFVILSMFFSFISLALLIALLVLLVLRILKKN